MSELKTRFIDDTYSEYYKTGHHDLAQIYTKSEADKVIALLKDKANYNETAYKLKSEELADTCRFYEDEIRHHKYKRCLVMAKWCEAEVNKCLTQQGELICFSETDRFQYLQGHFMHFSRWHKRWLELAEKFKKGE